MPFNYRIFDDIKLVYVKGEGNITFDDLMHHINELASDPHYVAPMKKLVDLRVATKANLTIAEEQKFADRKSCLIEKFRDEMCAFVTASDLDFGMSRTHGAIISSTGITTNVFRNLEGALAWLDVDITGPELDVF
jgi:hypothetical protein